MRVDIERLREKYEDGLLVQRDWGEPGGHACLMSALAGGYDRRECAAAGWPRWLVEYLAAAFDEEPNIHDAYEFGVGMAELINSVDVDWDRVWKRMRLEVQLPMAARKVADWPRQFQETVQWQIRNDGAPAAPNAAGPWTREIHLTGEVTGEWEEVNAALRRILREEDGNS